jgi:hypothetical protein
MIFNGEGEGKPVKGTMYPDILCGRIAAKAAAGSWRFWVSECANQRLERFLCDKNGLKIGESERHILDLCMTQSFEGRRSWQNFGGFDGFRVGG